MRLAGKAVGGYFPTPASLVARIAALVSVAWEGTPAWSTLNVIDPCAGDGAAVFGAMRAWSTEAQRAAGRVRFCGVEMEHGRARGLIERTRAFPDRRAVAFCGDGLRVDVSSSNAHGDEGAGSILYLNPPYDTDRECGRLEERFLRAWTPRLAPGGALVLLVPVESLAASADTLARFYTGLRCYRFPEAEYAAFRQVVLVARREHGAALPDATLRLQVLLWASDPASIPVLPEAPAPVIEARLPTVHFAAWAPRPVDALAIRAAFRPWSSTSRTGDLGDVANVLPAPSAALLRAEWPVAMPPRPSHIAAALAAGVFSGAEVSPDDAATGLPRLLLKAVFERMWVPREEKTNAKGEVVGEVQQQVTRLAITALDLSTYAYHTLSMSSEATGATTMSGAFTAGDLLARYKRSLADVLRDRCQVLHDPQRDGEDVALPTLARPLYAAQAHAARAAVKLLERGDGTQPLLLGEIGSGKSSCALAVAAARHRRSVLVMCPPHLLTSWRKQTTVVFGGAVPHDVFSIDSVTEVDAYAAWRASEASAGRIGVVLLSRERAKLGHAWESVTTERCPACGAFLGPEKSPGERARRRLRCEAVDRTPRNAAARIVEGLVVALLHRWPDHPSVAGNVPRGLRETMRKVVKARLAAGRPAINTSRSEATLRAPVRLAATRALDLLHAETDYRAESTQRDFAMRIVSALGDEGLALDVAERALAYPAPKDRHDHIAQNALTRATMAALSLCLLVRTPTHRERRDALAQALCARIPAPSFREWQTKAASLAGESVSLPRGDHWHTLARASGGGVVLTLDGAKHAFGDLDDLPEALRAFEGLASWKSGKPCGSPLYQPEGERGGITEALQLLRAVAAGDASQAPRPTPGVLRRVPLATYIARNHAGLFDFMVADEAHELSSETSAQGRASTRLVNQIPEVLHLTGSSSNGYASSLFTMLWNASPRFRREFRRDEEGRFVELYGLRKRLAQEVDAKGKAVAFGSHSDRVEVRYTDKGDAPGVLPLLILKHVLPIAVTIQKADLRLELPAHEERVIAVKPDEDLARAHGALLAAVLRQVKKDAFTPLTGKLWGALAHLPSHADRATEDTGNWTGDEESPLPLLVEACGIKGGVIPRGAYVVAYPASAYGCAGNPVAIAAPLSSSVPTAKERELVRVVREELAEGRRVMVHAWHETKCVRLAKILADALGEPVARLDAKKVSPAKREDWIDAEVVAKGRRVMVVNPVAVQTGLNNLVWFQTSVWMENPACNPVIYDQASGRIDRIGKTAVSRSIFLVYALPTQEALHRLLMQKVGVLRAIDGLDGDAALAMAGANDDNIFAGMGLGRELYAMLTGEAA